MKHNVNRNLVIICEDYPIEKYFAVKTGDLIKPVTDEAFVTLGWYRRVVQLLTLIELNPQEIS
jgi:hypothetical protein